MLIIPEGRVRVFVTLDVGKVFVTSDGRGHGARHLSVPETFGEFAMIDGSVRSTPAGTSTPPLR